MTDIDHNDTEAYNERAIAYNFTRSARGQFIISQALHIAVEELKKVKPKAMQEQSNIIDMEYLVEHLYPLYRVVHSGEGEGGGPQDD